MSVKIACPWCGQHYLLDECAEGGLIVCKRCGKEVSVTKELMDACSHCNILNGKEVKSTLPSNDDRTQAIPPMRKKENEPNVCVCFKAVSVICVAWMVVKTALMFFLWKGDPIGRAAIEMNIAVWMTRALLFWGCAKLLYYVSEIRKQTIRQRELLERLLDRHK